MGALRRSRDLVARGLLQSFLAAKAKGCGALRRAPPLDKRTWRSSERPARLASTPFLQLSTCRGTKAFRTGLRRTTSRRPVLVPVGRSVGVDRVGTSSENSSCRGPPALPVKLPVDTDPLVKSGEAECTERIWRRGLDLRCARRGACAQPSPLVGEGGPALCAGSDEGDAKRVPVERCGGDMAFGLPLIRPHSRAPLSPQGEKV